MFKVTAETFAETIKVSKTDKKSVLWIKVIDIEKKLDVRTFMTWLINKLKENLRLIIQQMNKLKSIKNMDQSQFMVKNLCILMKVL